MKLSEFLRRDLIKIDLEAIDKWEAIEELIDYLVGVHEIRMSDRDEILECVMKRERSMSTGMEKGVAIPHGSTNRVEEIVVAMGIAKKGIPFESMDGKPAKIVILLIIPKDRFQKHVRTLAGIARLLNNDEIRREIISSNTPEELFNVIFCHEESEIQQEKYF
ncbi:MAG: PTS sugar transporter subunit IIA [bacterium]|nr:PTS sugar transporter subunit IIA [bacterium]